MAQGIPIAAGILTTSTAESVNQVQNTYDYLGAGMLYLYARGSAATVLCSLFVQGNQICRNLLIIWFGTSGAMSASDHLVIAGKSMGGRIELTFRATTATPTVDYLLTFDSMPGGKLLSRLLGR